MRNIIFLAAFLVLVMPEIANAGYLDPGSGSTLAQGIAAFIASITRFFRRIFKRGK